MKLLYLFRHYRVKRFKHLRKILTIYKKLKQQQLGDFKIVSWREMIIKCAEIS